MGKDKYMKKIMGLFERSPVVNYSSIQKYAGNKEAAKQLVYNLIFAGKIRKLAKGFYTVHDNIQLSVFCFKPSYFGLQDAMSHHGIWEQETIPVIITSRKVRVGIRKVMGVNILVRRVEKKYMFGFEYVNQGEIYFPYSDIEKTFIDMIYFKEKLSLESINEFCLKIDKKKLMEYLRRYSPKFRKKVLSVLG